MHLPVAQFHHVADLDRDCPVSRRDTHQIAAMRSASRDLCNDDIARDVNLVNRQSCIWKRSGKQPRKIQPGLYSRSLIPVRPVYV